MTAILMPCAGFGSRLNLPYPKEIHAINRDECLIDLSLKKMLPFFQPDTKIVCIAPKFKSDVFVYLINKYASRFKVEFVETEYQEPEYTGSLLQARKFIKDGAIVLLPDSTFDPKFDFKEFWSVVEENNRSGKPTFLTQRAGGDILKTKGALKIVSNRVIEYFDKPEKPDGYNAYWGAFTLPPGDTTLELLHCVTNRLPYDKQKLDNAMGSTPLFIENYLDLGTWRNLKNFIIQNA